MCLTATDPNQAKFYYVRALKGATPQNKDAVIGQLRIYQALGVRADNVAAAIAGIPTA